MFKYKSLLIIALTFNAALFYTKEAAAQPSNAQVILNSERLRPKAAPDVKPRCNNFWGCLNLNSGRLPVVRIFNPVTPRRNLKPECKNNAWACPVLAPQGNTSSSQSSFR
ncbi:hypothetical protein DSM106972_048980 [Dulcicalothrix desertica PCC 7102]|uniref:Uncharacterized protein n=1 Tax=Dulcicalothrix desertica PCC 7102 TaxID=232991 RepID=A0A3S1ALL8_9CYAN|nr:hypothetical protein [Dulcicalothrix desertica]RUT03984.1 hypothetical protein DSM106972_048980 [Dulcicalothrix desertica PCC 7102]TWH43610.1 hypothetical protein CAL7102_07347 [Dulcicalothrix desertica PCC 7102]